MGTPAEEAAAAAAKTQAEALEQAQVTARGAGSHYQTAYTYFYVPKSAGANNTAVDDTGLGALLRLGGYSDLEAKATNQAAYFPAQHIADEGAGPKSYTGAAGKPLADSKSGILLACDGRVLVRGGERVYIHSGQKMDIEAGEEVGVRAGKKVSLRSGVDTPDTYKLSPNNKTKTHGIEIIANEGKSDIYIESKSMYLAVNGVATNDVTEKSFNVLRADVDTKMYANNKELVKGNNHSIVEGDDISNFLGNTQELFRGAQLSCHLGAAASYNLGVSLGISTSLDVSIGVFDLGVTAFDMSVTGLDMSATGTDCDTSAIKHVSNGLHSAKDGVKSAGSAVYCAADGLVSRIRAMGNTVSNLENTL